MKSRKTETFSRPDILGLTGTETSTETRKVSVPRVSAPRPPISGASAGAGAGAGACAGAGAAPKVGHPGGAPLALGPPADPSHIEELDDPPHCLKYAFEK